MINDVVLVFGSGRSGTSWLSETMAQPRGYRLLFEPEHEEHVPEGKVLTDRLLIPGEYYPEADQFLRRIFTNRIDNDWIAKCSNRKFKMHLWPFLIKRKIIKFVRCSLGMHYISQQINAPSIYIRRDPFSTIYSQNRVKFPWLYDLSRFKEQPELVKELEKRYGINILQSEFTDIEKLAIRWGIENIFPFQYFPQPLGDSKIISLDYEELAGNLDLYLEILSQVEFDAPSNLEKLFNRPSSKTHPKSNINKGNSANYKTLLTESDLEGIITVLRLFDPKYT